MNEAITRSWPQDHPGRNCKLCGDRAAAEEIVRSAGEDCYRDWFDDDVSPEDAADEELQEWTE